LLGIDAKDIINFLTRVWFLFDYCIQGGIVWIKKDLL
jgi:hypothetical protein